MHVFRKSRNVGAKPYCTPILNPNTGGNDLSHFFVKFFQWLTSYFRIANIPISWFPILNAISIDSINIDSNR